MLNKINIHLIEYSLSSILRQKRKNGFIFIIFTMLIFLLSSIFFISNSIKYELNTTLDSLPQIIVQNQKARKAYDIDINIADEILDIAGVNSVNPRVWGYYYFANAGVNFTIIGIDEYEKQYKNTFTNLTKNHTLQDDFMLVGSGVKDIMQKYYYTEYFNFIKSDGSMKKVYLKGVFKSQTNLESNDIIVLTKESARDIFGMDEELSTDIVVSVKNKDEIPTIVSKIQNKYPSTRVITNNDLKISYQNIFDYKSGIFLSLFTISLFTFFMILYDKVSGVTSEEKKEIAVLKAIGWRVDDVIKSKFYESFIISFSSYIMGILFAFIFVYILKAPLLRNIFIGYSELKPDFVLPFIFDLQTIFLIFFLTIPIYIAATIIPSWKIATMNSDEVLRS